MFCTEYKGTDNYVDKPAVRDGNLITAAVTGNANEFFAMMQSLQK